jgi:hypothetical protein
LRKIWEMIFYVERSKCNLWKARDSNSGLYNAIQPGLLSSVGDLIFSHQHFQYRYLSFRANHEKNFWTFGHNYCTYSRGILNYFLIQGYFIAEVGPGSGIRIGIQSKWTGSANTAFKESPVGKIDQKETTVESHNFVIVYDFGHNFLPWKRYFTTNFVKQKSCETIWTTVCIQ